MSFKNLLPYAMKEKPCDAVFRNASFANLYTMETEQADVAVKDGVIVGIGEGYEAAEEIDCAGGLLIPGFIEGHMHVESTTMTPRSFAAAAVPHGTATVMADPHEIANTCGMEGVRFMKRESEGLPLDIFYGAPSCVPASCFETPFEEIKAGGIAELLADGTCTHLGEMMNFPGVYLGDEEVWKKLEAAEGTVITGHAPGVSGAQLAGYLLGGVTSDHECATLDEAREKLRRGMYLMIRQGAAARNLKDLAPLLVESPNLCARCLAVSDDITPAFIRERGHMDGCVRKLIECGVPPLAALRTATLTPAEYFRLYDRGAIAPGKIADLVLVDSLESCRVLRVWKRGRLVAERGKILESLAPAAVSELPGLKQTVRTPTPDELKIKLGPDDKYINVIGVVPRQFTTETLTLEPAVIDGCACADPSRRLAKMAVVEKNRGTGRLALGFLHNFPLERGAVASSVAHDAHNYTCAGMDDVSMSTALRELARMHGGIVVAEGEKVLASLELPVGGLMSLLSADELLEKLADIRAAAESIRCPGTELLMQLSFMSLSVIPKLKLTDQGYCDITAGGAQPLTLAELPDGK